MWRLGLMYVCVYVHMYNVASSCVVYHGFSVQTTQARIIHHVYINVCARLCVCVSVHVGGRG